MKYWEVDTICLKRICADNDEGFATFSITKKRENGKVEIELNDVNYLEGNEHLELGYFANQFEDIIKKVNNTVSGFHEDEVKV